MEAKQKNEAKIISRGEDYFEALYESFDNAQEEILLTSYVFKDDSVGKKVIDKLLAASERGVSVYVTIDSLGSGELSEEGFSRMKNSKIYLHWFGSFFDFLFKERLKIQRLHFKVICIDRKIAFVGGMNITDQHCGEDPNYSMYDLVVRLEGPIVARIRKLTYRFQLFVRKRYRTYFQTIKAKKDDPEEDLRFVVRDNFKHRRSIYRDYIKAVKAAKRSILIVNPYFFPPRRFLRLLSDQADRGVSVRLMLQGRSDHPYLKNATRWIVYRLQKSGVRVFEYNKKVLHAKAAVMDDNWATIGSFNLDSLSIFSNLEANIISTRETLVEDLKTRLEAEIYPGATELKLETLHWGQRLVCWLNYLGFSVMHFVIRQRFYT